MLSLLSSLEASFPLSLVLFNLREERLSSSCFCLSLIIFSLTESLKYKTNQYFVNNYLKVLRYGGSSAVHMASTPSQDYCVFSYWNGSVGKLSLNRELSQIITNERVILTVKKTVVFETTPTKQCMERMHRLFPRIGLTVVPIDIRSGL
jgi:hypothetical protein